MAQAKIFYDNCPVFYYNRAEKILHFCQYVALPFFSLEVRMLSYRESLRKIVEGKEVYLTNLL